MHLIRQKNITEPMLNFQDRILDIETPIMATAKTEVVS